MTSGDISARGIRYRKLRAPQADGAALIVPPLNQVAPLVEANRTAALNWNQLTSAPLAMWRSLARRELVTLAALSIGEQLTDEEAARRAERPIILSGHQPTLFHPGVWLKNFVLSQSAEHVGGTAINLVIDSDAAHSPGIRVPAGSPDGPHVEFVPLDAPSDEVPWEERRVTDVAFARAFASRVRDIYVGSGPILLDRIWPHAEAIMQGTPPETLRWGTCLAAARHRLEQEIGLKTQEALFSRICDTVTVAQFSSHLFSRAGELHAIYNTALAEYRAVNHIRSRSHPVPDLAVQGDWLEVPFWLWTRDDPRRSAAFVRPIKDGWELSDLKGVTIRELPADNGAGNDSGIKLRPRALITTMYARLVLGDLFIHGVGGAKYDELTDAIIRQLFGIEPPAYITATATFRLPIDRPQVTAADVQANQWRLRDLRYRPESFLHDPLAIEKLPLRTQLEKLAADKRDYLRAHSLRGAPREVFLGLDTLNRQMQTLLKPIEDQLREEQARLASALKQTQLLGSREFSFVLFPKKYLIPRLLELSKVSA